MYSDVIVRAAGLDDLPGLLRLYRDLNSNDPELDNAVTSAAWSRMLATSGLTVFVAELAGSPSILGATCTLFVLPNLTAGARPHAMIENVVTLVAYRQRGLGQAVLRAAQDAAFAAGCYKIVLTTGSRREETRRFYERAGFARNTRTAFEMRRA